MRLNSIKLDFDRRCNLNIALVLTLSIASAFAQATWHRAVVNPSSEGSHAKRITDSNGTQSGPGPVGSWCSETGSKLAGIALCIGLRGVFALSRVMSGMISGIVELAPSR